MLKEIAIALDVNYWSVYEPTLYAAEDIMYTPFELDEHYLGMSIYEVVDDSDQFDSLKHMSVCFNSPLPDEFISEWKIRK